MTSAHKDLKGAVYGGLGEGKVQEPIDVHIESLLREDLSGNSTGHSSTVDGGVYSH